MSAGPLPAPFLSGEFTIAVGHPALAGHFPGNPIVPGVLVLQRVLSLLETALPAFRTLTLKDVKFSRPLRPAERCAIALHRVDGQTLVFVCRVDENPIARGAVVVDLPG